MTLQIDLKALSARESEQVEWKENVADPLDVVETIVAFANDLSNLGGGYVVCGAREVKDAYGFQQVEMIGMTADRCKGVEGTVLAVCLSHVAPPLHPVFEELRTDSPERRILVFVVPASSTAHTFRRKDDGGKHYIRVGRETREARNGLLRELLVLKGAREAWDMRPCPSATRDDLDLLGMRELLVRLRAWDDARAPDSLLTAPLSPFTPAFCAREPLTGVLRPRNFALLLFGREPWRFLPDAHVIWSAYPGPDRAEPFAERQEIAGTILHQIDRLQSELERQARTVMDKSSAGAPNGERYPLRALTGSACQSG